MILKHFMRNFKIQTATSSQTGYEFDFDVCILRILSPDPSTFYDHFTTTIVDIDPYISWLLIIDPYASQPFTCVDYFSPLKRINHE